MLKLGKLLLTIGGGLLVYDATLMAKGKPNPIKGLPLPCPITLSMIGTGLILFVLGRKNHENDCDCDYDCFDCYDQDDCINF